MTVRRSRRRLAKLRRGAAVTIGCCLAAAASSSSSSAATTAAAAAMDVPSYRVTPNNTPRKKLEKRRRLEQDYYRQLASKQQQQEKEKEESSEEVNDHSSSSLLRAGNDSSSSRGRRLPSNEGYMGLHKKKNNISSNQAQTTVHKKGNKESSIDFMLMGNNNNSHGKNNNPSSPNDTPPAAAASATDFAAQTPKEEDVQEDDDDDDDLNAATNLRKFTRIGGTGYALPPTKRFPYMCSLQLEGHYDTAQTYDIHMCGGVLVAPDLVMTAAHCANYRPPGSDEVHRAFNGIEIGKTDLSNEGVPFDPYSLETYKLYYENLVPEKLHLHPQFDEGTYENDVMLVKVFGMSKFPPVKIRRDDVSRDEGQSVITMIGWGADSASSPQKFSNNLKTAEMNLMTKDQCRNTNVEVVDPSTDKSSILSLHDHVFDDMMCATSNNNRRYMCYGDAGGPAIVQGNNNDEDEVYGILSWGYGCVNRDYPAVMAKVPDHYEWLRRTICKASSDPPDEYGCGGGNGQMTALSGGPKQTVTLKLKLDKMAVESGFVIQHRDTGEIVAQRQTGYWKSEKYGNEIVLETMQLPRNQCYKLILLDSYGDGLCCDMGGGNAVVYSGTDVGYYSGIKLAEVNGNFEFDSSTEFCTTSPVNSIQVSNPSNNHEKENPGSSATYDAPSYTPPSPPRPPPPPPAPPRTPRPTREPTPKPIVTPQSNLQYGSGGGGGGGGSNNNNDQGGGGGGATWSGPVMNPEYEYCSQFCSTSSHGVLCGTYECVHISDVVTSDNEGNQGDGSQGPDDHSQLVVDSHILTSTEFYDEDSEYYLTVQFQFDDNPQEVSWVLYDLTNNEVKTFVDFDVYTKEEYANHMLNIAVTVDGPEEGEKKYAFTVYDKDSNGLCCEFGDGYYKVFLGDEEDDLELLGDDEYEFSSSYYFTLFEMEGQDAELETSMPTHFPSAEPTTKRPTNHPTNQPTPNPTRHPTHSPTTERPTNPWEKRRPEHMDDIGAKWNIRTNTPPGVFNDIGGDQHQYRFNMDGSIRNAAANTDSFVRKIVVVGTVLVCTFFILQF